MKTGDRFDLGEERKRIAKEKKMFLEQKLKLEEGMMVLQKSSSNLMKQVGCLKIIILGFKG